MKKRAAPVLISKVFFFFIFVEEGSSIAGYKKVKQDACAIETGKRCSPPKYRAESDHKMLPQALDRKAPEGNL